MSPEVDSAIFNDWSYERDAAVDLIAAESRRAVEKAAKANRMGTAFAAGQLSDALCPAVEAKAARVITKTREIFESHGEVPTEEDGNSLRAKFARFLEAESAQVQAAVFKLEHGGDVATRLARNTLEKIRARSDHDFKLMLAATKTAAAKKMQTTNNITHSNVQLGDHNTQNNQITLFRDILAKIDASENTPEQKAEAKSALTKFLEHPVVVGTVGALAAHVFK